MKAYLRSTCFALLAACAMVCLDGCSTVGVLRSAHAVSDCDGAILSTRFIQGGRRLHDRVRYVSGETSVGYDVITEVDDDGLRVIVLTPFGNKAIGLRQVGEQVEIANYMGSRLVVAPMNVLRDLHRVHFLRSESASVGASDGHLSIGGFDVVERLENSVTTRRIAGPDAYDRATVTIDSDAAVVERDGCRYSARFVTLP